MKKFFAAIMIAGALALAYARPAAAQSGCPTIITGAVLTAAQWNACFQAKTDNLGYTPLNIAGGTMSGRLVTAAPGATLSGLNLTPGTAPGSPFNGDMWATSSGLFVQINGSTVGPLASAAGGPFTGQILDSGATTTSPGWYVSITGDTTPRVRVGMNATDVPSIAFGPGNANRDLFLERVGAGALRLGAPDAASPVAQILSVQNVLAGTSNTAGANRTISGSQGTGTGIGGSIIFQVAPAGSSGSAQNALATALTIFGDAGMTTGSPTGGDKGAGTLNLAGLAFSNGNALAVSASSPLVLNATTGALTCPTCVTSSGGGAITGTSPVVVSAAGAVSVQGAAGTVLQGQGGGSVFTAVPTVGVAGALLGGIQFANLTSGLITVSPPTGALGSVTNTLQAVTDTFVYKATPDTLTNKTLTSPAINAAALSGTFSGNATFSGANAYGTPSSLTLTNATGLPVSTGLSGLGANVAIVLGNTVGGAGGITTTDGSAVLTNKSIAATQLTGTLQAAQEPAHTGDCTNSAGSLALTCLKTNGTNFTAGATAAAGQLPGETSTGSASAGNVGEYITTTGGSVAAASATAVNATSVSLTAGDWDVSCSIGYSYAATTTLQNLAASINTTSATLPGVGAINSFNFGGTSIVPNGGFTISSPVVRESLSGTTTVFCVGFTTYATSTASISGSFIRARRVR